MDNLIIFDLDGVITGEDAYWTTAGLVLHELLYSPNYWNIGNVPVAYHPAQTAEESAHRAYSVLPEAVILSLKARSLNSNWDTCYGGVSFYLIYLLTLVPDLPVLLPLRPADKDWITAFRMQLATITIPQGEDSSLIFPIHHPVFQGHIGFALFERLNVYASEVLRHPVEGVFARYSSSWKFCRNLFQEWYLGEQLYTQQYAHAPAQPGKPGCIHFEQPLLPVAYIRNTLEVLRKQGYTLGIATGRPRQEGLLPLEHYGLLHYFDEQHITTNTEVAQAEADLLKQGSNVSLVKPHPYQFALAADPAYQFTPSSHNGQGRGAFIVVGDTPSDVQGGRDAGALVVAVLSGARTPEARKLLKESGPDFIIDDMTNVPELLADMDSLGTIQRLQFTEREKAELLLRRWFARHMGITPECVRLAPKAVSLNSFNGFYRIDGEEYFFKTHVEDQGVLEEYYHAELLHKVGYNIVRPLRTLHQQGRQMVIYPVVHWPVMFDLMRAIETGCTEETTLAMLVSAEKQECQRLLDIYKTTLASSTAEEHARAPIHQLFWHRLAGGRLKNFYQGKSVALPGSEEHVTLESLLTYQWKINGVEMPRTLGDLIARAIEVLNPQRATQTVIGHGDAHFGNVFLEDQHHYLYFDPAFAGRHSPLLDVVKPLFHNVFATWMYFPHDIERELHIAVMIHDTTVVIEHDYSLTPVRKAILQTKEEYLMKPLLAWLRSLDALPVDWLEFMQSALMCCPLLTINLIDTERVPPSISWLGLMFALLMANNGMISWSRGLEQ